jgi:spore coat protein CotH
MWSCLRLIARLRNHPMLVCAGAAGLALAVLAPAADAQTLDDFFNNQVLQEVRLQVNSKDLQNLHLHFTEDTYYPADFQWSGVKVSNVGIRNRGGGSRNPSKLGLRVEFDHYSPTNFLGLKTLVLNNVWQDASMLHESVAMAFFARMGQPAARAAFTKLYVNNEYSGVYLLEEAVDELFLRRTLGERTGYLFEDIYTYPYYGTDLGDNLGPYKTLFEIKDPHTNDSDSLLYQPIRNLFREVNQARAATWLDVVSQYLDLGQFITHIALENFLAEFDGVLGYAGMNNFYIYRSGATTPHRFIVKDKSQTFSGSDYPIFQNADQNSLTIGAFAFDDLRNQYLDMLSQCAASADATDTPGDVGWLEGEIAREANLIRDAAYADPLKYYTSDAFDQDIVNITQFGHARGKFVTTEVGKARKPQ